MVSAQVGEIDVNPFLSHELQIREQQELLRNNSLLHGDASESHVEREQNAVHAMDRNNTTQPMEEDAASESSIEGEELEELADILIENVANP